MFRRIADWRRMRFWQTVCYWGRADFRVSHTGITPFESIQVFFDTTFKVGLL